MFMCIVFVLLRGYVVFRIVGCEYIEEKVLGGTRFGDGFIFSFFLLGG